MSPTSVSSAARVVKCSSCAKVVAAKPALGFSTGSGTKLPPKPEPTSAKSVMALKPTGKLTSFSDVSKKKVDLKPSTAVGSSRGVVANRCGTNGLHLATPLNAFPILNSVRFGSVGTGGSRQLSTQEMVNALNARSIAATNPITHSPQALAGPVQPGRGAANLSAVSVANVRLPEMGMSPFKWAEMNGITISWDNSGQINGAASPDTRHIVLGSQLMNLPEPVLWYALYHEIGHVLGGHSERQARPSPVRFEWEHDADRYARQAMTVDDVQKDTWNKNVVADWLRQLQPDAEHEPGWKIAQALLETVQGATAKSAFAAIPMAA